MVNTTITQLKGGEIKVGRYDVYSVKRSTGETITLSDYSSSLELDQALLVRCSDRTSITFTKSKNVITITQSGLTDVDCLLFVVGVAA